MGRRFRPGSVAMTVSATLSIRSAHSDDADAIWAIIEPAVRAGETLALARDIDQASALSTYWMRPDNSVFVAELEGQIVGSYFLRANQSGGGSHVCNAGYATAPSAAGKGVARQMCEHSLATAKAQGFTAMQYNFVVSSNERAVRLWQSCGFDIVGTLPLAFHNPTLGLVDALIMYRTL
jgi:ribosomal protein S18 acetylase RimI-like enzyme